MASRTAVSKRRARALRRGLAGCALLGAWLAGATTAHAEGKDTQAADALFKEARHLMDQGKFKDACPKFKESQDKDPAVGTMLNLADCYEKTGQLATAWTQFHEAEAEAKRIGRVDRERTARERARALDNKLSKVIFVLAEHGSEVRRDGVLVEDVTMPVPMDPGTHKIDVTAKGKKPFTTSIDVANGPAQQKLEIPRLDPDVTPPVAVTTYPNGAPPNLERPSNSPLRTVGLVTAGVGVAGLGVGAYFGLRSISTWSDVKGRCDVKACYDSQAVALAQDAHSSASISTLAFIGGGALTATGVVLYLVAPKGHTSETATATHVFPLVGGGQMGAGLEKRF